MTQRFYFDLSNGISTIRDTKGAEATDLGEAIRDAQAVLDEMQDAKGSEWVLIVRDASGKR